MWRTLDTVAMTATTTGTGWLVERYTEAIVVVDVTAVSGTSPTLDITVQTSADNSIWATLTTFTQITSVSTNIKFISNIGKYVRVKYTIGGSSTPTFTMTSKISVKT